MPETSARTLRALTSSSCSTWNIAFAANPEYAALGPGDLHRFFPLNSRYAPGLRFQGRKDLKDSALGNPFRSMTRRDRHFVDGAEGYGVKHAARRHFLHAPI